MPATDEPATLSACTAAIAAAAEPPEEVLVPEMRLRSGPSAARNAGAGTATGDVLVFVDSDVAVHPDAFVRIRLAFATDPELTAVFGSYDDAPAGTGLVSTFRNLLHHHVHQSSAGDVGTFWAGLGAIRREAFEAAGGFDAGRFHHPSMEDVELGMRLADAGARIELDPLLLGKHLKTWTLAGMVRTDVVRRGTPWVALLLRRKTMPSELNLSWANRFAALSWLFALGALLRRRPTAAAAGVVAAAIPNISFYRLLRRRLGLHRALAGVALHGLHYLCATAAIPLGLVAHVREERAAEEEPPEEISAGRVVERAPEVQRAETAVRAPRLRDELELGRKR